jgi:hypothetical protein
LTNPWSSVVHQKRVTSFEATKKTVMNTEWVKREIDALVLKKMDETKLSGGGAPIRRRKDMKVLDEI